MHGTTQINYNFPYWPIILFCPVLFFGLFVCLFVFVLFCFVCFCFLFCFVCLFLFFVLFCFVCFCFLFCFVLFVFVFCFVLFVCFFFSCSVMPVRKAVGCCCKKVDILFVHLCHFFVQLQGSGPEMFVAWLRNIFEHGFVDNSTESE